MLAISAQILIKMQAHLKMIASVRTRISARQDDLKTGTGWSIFTTNAHIELRIKQLRAVEVRLHKRYAELAVKLYSLSTKI